MQTNQDAAGERVGSAVAAASAPSGRRRSTADARAEVTWLPIGDAAALLGVSPATLRLWTAAGKVRAHVTPGGHRRYTAADLQQVLAETRSAGWEAAAERLVASLRRRYADLARGQLPRQRWFGLFDEAARARVHALGEALLAVVGRLLAAPGDAERARLLREARRIGTQYGREVARRGLAVSDALEAFLFFRTPILESVNGTVREHPGLALPAGEALAAVTELMDVVLLALTRSYERRRGRARVARPAAERAQHMASRAETRGAPPVAGGARTRRPVSAGTAGAS